MWLAGNPYPRCLPSEWKLKLAQIISSCFQFLVERASAFWFNFGNKNSFTRGGNIYFHRQISNFATLGTTRGDVCRKIKWRPYQNNRKITRTIGKIPKSTNPNITLLRKLTHTLTQTLTLNLTPFLTLTLTRTNLFRPLIAFFSCIWYCSVDLGTRSTVLVGQYICAK